MITNTTTNHAWTTDPHELYGLAKDTKPTDVPNASLFYEMDTKKMYLFCAESKTWLEQ